MEKLELEKYVQDAILVNGELIGTHPKNLCLTQCSNGVQQKEIMDKALEICENVSTDSICSLLIAYAHPVGGLICVLTNSSSLLCFTHDNK